MSDIAESLDRLPALEAVERARAVGDDEATWKALDRTLRLRLLELLQDRQGDAAELARALVEAADWAARAEAVGWRERWRGLLELLRDGERMPSIAREAEALLAEPGGWPATFLRRLAEWGSPARPGALAQVTGLTQSHVSNVLGRLERAGLVVRRRGPGRAVLVLLSARGRRLAALLQTAPVEAVEGPALPAFWDARALDQPVDLN